MKLKFYNVSFILILVFLFNNTMAQNNSYVKKAQDLLKDYTVRIPNQISPTASPKQMWQNEYNKYSEKSTTIRYCDSIIAFSSQYSGGSWSANQIIGPPNVYPGYGDNGGAWASSSSDNQREFLELHFKGMPISNIAIYETFSCGAIDTIYIKNPNNGNWEIVWQGDVVPIYISRIFEVEFPLTSFSVSEVRLAINSPAVSGYNEIDAVAIANGEINPFYICTMPSYSASQQYANAVINQDITVWGNVNSGTPPFNYLIDFGDGTADSGAVTDMHFFGSNHQYINSGVKTVKFTVTDADGLIRTKESLIRVYAAASQQTKINIAIEKGLLFLYLNQYPEGNWNGEDYIGATGMSVLSFEENGHLPNNNYFEDVYAKYVKKGLNYILSQAYTMPISVQPAGNPDSDGDGLGVYFAGGNTYSNGIGFLALIGAHRNQISAKLDTIEVGVYAGQTYYDLITDAIDIIAYSQTDADAGDQRGGWRYNINTGNAYSSDNSAVQWPALVLEAAENSWGMATPQFVKDELKLWLIASQQSDGGFGYQYPWMYVNIAKTGAGIGSYAYLGYNTDSSAVANALVYTDAHWFDTSDPYGWRGQFYGNLYAIYGMAKGLRIINHRVGITNVAAHNWYEEYANFLLTDPTFGQQSDGHWYNYEFFATENISSAFAVLVLTQGVVIPPPVAVIEPIGSHPINTSFEVNGSGSYHQDPNKSIIEWKWDWDASDGINWDDPDAFGPNPINPGYADSGKYTISLRIMDNSEPPMFDIETSLVQINDTTTNNPPVAVAIPPNMGAGYAGKIGESIKLDGSYSYDPDYPRDSVVVYKWDTNGDGTFGDFTTPQVTLTFNNEYQGEVGLRVYDTHSDSSSNIAYINIVASLKDIYVVSSVVTSTSVINGKLKAVANEVPIIPGDTLNFFVVFKNNDTSNTDVYNALVRFYDENPLTIGNRLGGDYFVDLPVGGYDTVNVSFQFPNNVPIGLRKVYVFLDPLEQVPEWNEVNNLASNLVDVVMIPKPKELIASAPSIGEVLLNWIDQSNNEAGFAIERKLGIEAGPDTFVVIDSVSANEITYTDETVLDSTTYTYRVRAFNDYFYSDYSNLVTIKTLFTSVEDNIIPTEFSVSQNFPNPFNPATLIKYALPNESKVTIKIFNVLGETVAVLKNGIEKEGYYQVTWNAKDIASGVYFFELNAASTIDSKKYNEVRKMTLLK